MYQQMQKNKIEVQKTPSPKAKVKDPPNFEKLHERFTKTLEAKKKAKQTTEIEPFMIDARVEESNKKKMEKIKKKEEEMEKLKKIEEEKQREERRKARINAKEE